jgi:hypothetical protein
MKKNVFLIFLLVSLFGNAQTNISGTVTNSKNHPLAGISITLKGSYDGTTSDSSGRYSFKTDEKGPQTIIASASGFRSSEQNLILDRDLQTLNITLKEMVTELKAVMITAGTFEASDQKKTTVLNSIDIVTTASANADITAAIKTLPGTQQVGETEGLFVRGGTANESKTFIDGTLVNNFYYSSEPGLAQRGRFNPFIFKGTIFSAGGYSALYGQALSSALILESLDLPERSSGQVAFSYLSVGGGLQQLAKNKRSSWGVSYNYLDLRVAFNLIRQKPDYYQVPVGHQGDANFRIKTSNSGMLKYYGIISSTRVGFRYADIDSSGMKDAFGLNNLNMYHNLSWKEKLGDGLKMIAGLSFSTNKDDIKNEFQNQDNQKQLITDSTLFAFKNISLVTHGRYVNGKIVIEKKLNGLSIVRFGSEYNYSNDKNDFTIFNGNIYPSVVKEKLISGFGETDIYITNDIAAKIGARAEHSYLLDKWNLAPRLSLAYKLPGTGQLSFAYGIFYQDPEKKYLPSSQVLHYSKATHYILQFQQLTNNRTLRTELFYKKYNDLFKTTLINNREVALNNNGYGEAKGIEFFWRDKRTIKNFDYWISYSYLDTKRDFLNYPFAIEPPFAARHTASLVMKKFVMKLKTQFNASYTYSTGRPYYNIRYDNTGNDYKIFDAGRTKDFNSLSFSVNYLPNIAKTNGSKFTVFVFSVTNILGSNNIYTYNYSYNGKNKQPVLPPSKRFFYLGCFISFGIDRTQDAIDNNL